MPNLISFNLVAAKRLTLIAFFLLAVNSLIAQKGELRNSVTASYTSFRLEPHDQYLGIGIDYRYMLRSWIGVAAQGSEAYEIQQTYDYIGGYRVNQADVVILTGKRWGKVSILGEAGFGIMRSYAFEGFNQQGDINGWRTYPDFLIGGFVNVAVARRWSLTYEVRDNLDFIGPLYIPAFVGVQTPSAKLNVPEGRIGVAFHF